jgi:succinate dehydrogenase / fumarate reductase, cytochrome b subunit
MASFLTTIRGYFSYRGREGHLAFLLHRVTGLGTLIFLSVHILDTSLVYFAPSLYDEIIELYRSVAFGIGEIFLVFSLFYHGVNGLRIAIFDLFVEKLWNISFERKSVWFTLIVSIILWIPAAILMVRSILIHHYGMDL